MLENLTQGLKAPCVMDVKIGARTYGPDATEAKMKQEDAKYLGTKVVFFLELWYLHDQLSRCLSASACWGSSVTMRKG